MTTGHMQKVVNAAPTPGEGKRVHAMISALVSAGLEAGYLVNPRLASVHWQAGDRQLPAPLVGVAGESVLWVDPAEIPSDDDVARLGKALGAGRHGDRDELMAQLAAYSGLRWGELVALTVPQVDWSGGLSPWIGRSSRSPGTFTPRRPRIVSAGRRSTRGAHPAGTRWPRSSRPASTRPVWSRRRALTRSGWSSHHRRGSTGGPPTSAATCSSALTLPPDGAVAMAIADGRGTACGTCFALRHCSRGNSMLLTCPAWRDMPTTASRWTCTSALLPASWIAPIQLPNSGTRSDTLRVSPLSQPERGTDRMVLSMGIAECRYERLSSVRLSHGRPGSSSADRLLRIGYARSEGAPMSVLCETISREIFRKV